MLATWLPMAHARPRFVPTAFCGFDSRAFAGALRGTASSCWTGLQSVLRHSPQVNQPVRAKWWRAVSLNCPPIRTPKNPPNAYIRRIASKSAAPDLQVISNVGSGGRARFPCDLDGWSKGCGRNDTPAKSLSPALSANEKGPSPAVDASGRLGFSTGLPHHGYRISHWTL